MFMRWDESLSVGIQTIDDQHKGWIELTNKFERAIEGKRSEQVMRSTISEMIEYARHHFATEEDLMLRIDYPHRKNHMREHHLFIGKLQSYVENLKKNDSEMPLDMLEFMKFWIVNHISSVDKDYSKYATTK